MSLEELNQKLKQQNLIGYWTLPNTSTGFREPEPSFGPFLWKWREIRAAVEHMSTVSVICCHPERTRKVSSFAQDSSPEFILSMPKDLRMTSVFEICNLKFEIPSEARSHGLS